MKMKTEIGVMLQQAKECQGLQAKHQRQGGVWNRFSLTVPEGINLTYTLTLDSWLQNGNSTFLLF